MPSHQGHPRPSPCTQSTLNKTSFLQSETVLSPHCISNILVRSSTTLGGEDHCFAFGGKEPAEAIIMFFRGLVLLSPRSAREYSGDRKSRIKIAHPPQRLFTCSSDVDHQSTVDISHQQYQSPLLLVPHGLLPGPGASPSRASPPQRCPFSCPLCPPHCHVFPYGHCLWSQPKSFALPWGTSCSVL